MEKYAAIIIDALRDYRLWYMEQGGTEEEIEEDNCKIKEIDEAIDYVFTILNNKQNGQKHL